MKPARMPSSRVKILPWYYADRDAPSRAADKSKHIAEDIESSGDPDIPEGTTMTDPMPAIRNILGMPEADEPLPPLVVTIVPEVPDYADNVAQRIVNDYGTEDTEDPYITHLIAVGVRAGYALGYGARG